MTFSPEAEFCTPGQTGLTRKFPSIPLGTSRRLVNVANSTRSQTGGAMPMQRKCPRCGNSCSDTLPSCLHCGLSFTGKIQPQANTNHRGLADSKPARGQVICKRCGNSFSETLTSCLHCGLKLDSADNQQSTEIITEKK